ncbi:MAG TPA: hypothetical protein EYP03_05905, partial [Aquificae bacterium]|nr:hypothetical protein [Aquificota bacterium]
KSIGKVEKSIMRLAAFEIMIEGVDKRIIINEAINKYYLKDILNK